jgi:hypothetical protein
MGMNYNESARRLAEQKRERMRVIKRQKIKKTIVAGTLYVALTVGLTYMFINGADKDWESRNRATEAFRDEMYVPNITDEEKEQANKSYIEDHYSANTIKGLKDVIIVEYDVLIDAIVENQKLQVNSEVESLDSNRLDDAIANYGEFKKEYEQDKTNYEIVSEEDRINEASRLYNTRKSVLKSQLIEAEQKNKYLAEGSKEYNDNQEQIVTINRKINTINSALEVVMERSITIYMEKQQIEEGKQR